MPKVTNSDGGSGSWSAGQWRIVTSGGFSGLHRASSFSLGASAIAGDEGGMETGYDGRSVRWQTDLPQARDIGAEAGRRAAGRLGARKIASTTAPVSLAWWIAQRSSAADDSKPSTPTTMRPAVFMRPS